MPRILYAKAGATEIEDVIGMDAPYYTIPSMTKVLYQDQHVSNISCGNWFLLMDNVVAVCMSHDYARLPPAIPFIIDMHRGGHRMSRIAGNLMFIKVARYELDDYRLKEMVDILDMTDEDLDVVYQSVKSAKSMRQGWMWS